MYTFVEGDTVDRLRQRVDELGRIVMYLTAERDSWQRAAEIHNETLSLALDKVEQQARMIAELTIGRL
jgi:hypothetical protein